MNPNGTTRTGFVASIIIRRIAPTDGAGLERFYAELSDDSRPCAFSGRHDRSISLALRPSARSITNIARGSWP